MENLELSGSETSTGFTTKASIISPIAPKVERLNPKLADAVSALLNEAKARKLSVGLHSSVRDWDLQNKLYELGRTVVNPEGASRANPRGRIVTYTIGGYSWHNFGMAGDCVFKDEKGVWTWADNLPWEDLGRIGEMFGLEWGGRWLGRKCDRPHFQLKCKLSLIEAHDLVVAEGIEKLWAVL